MKHEVGQKLWLVHRQISHGETEEVEVVKVGRKWLTLSCGCRVEVDNLRTEGSDSTTCYLSRNAWEEDMALRESWRKFRLDVEGKTFIPLGVTVQKISDARKILGMSTTPG